MIFGFEFWFGLLYVRIGFVLVLGLCLGLVCVWLEFGYGFGFDFGVCNLGMGLVKFVFFGLSLVCELGF